MLLSLILLVVSALLAIALYQRAYERPHNFPPGPPRLPFWGSYWLLLLEDFTWMNKASMTLAKRYSSDVLGFYLGGFPTVVANGLQATREVLTRPEFAGRPDTVLTRVRSYGRRLGMFFVQGDYWTEQRRFVLRHLRDFGFGRRMASSEERLRVEAENLVGLVRGDYKDEDVVRDGHILVPGALHVPFVSLLWSMFAGRPFEPHEYKQVRVLSRAAATFVKSVDPMGRAVSQTPWLRHVAPKSSGFDGVKKAGAVLNAHLKAALDEHEQTFNEDEAPRDFIDHYIAQLKRDEKAGLSADSTFSREQLQVMGSDIWLATATTVTGAMTFAIKWLSCNPDIQKRCQEQLDKVVGRARTPCLDDRVSCPYVEAVIRETLRRNTMLPMSIPHQTMEDAKLHGYDIPKNSLMIINLDSAHMDKDYWGDPETFRPERFLDAKGQLLPNDPTMPFGAGKRLCPGETFSRQSMFVVLSALLQNFNFDMPKGTKPDISVPGLAQTPLDAWVRIIPRA